MAPPSSSNVVFAGYLTKQGSVVKSWKKRWCVINSKDEFWYYKDKDDPKPAGCIPLNEVISVFAYSKCQCVWPPVCDLNLAFGLVTAKRVWHMVSDSETEFKQWMETIKRGARIGAAIPIGAPVTSGTEMEVVNVTESGRTKSVVRLKKSSSQDPAVPNAGSPSKPSSASSTSAGHTPAVAASNGSASVTSLTSSLEAESNNHGTTSETGPQTTSTTTNAAPEVPKAVEEEREKDPYDSDDAEDDEAEDELEKKEEDD